MDIPSELDAEQNLQSDSQRDFSQRYQAHFFYKRASYGSVQNSWDLKMFFVDDLAVHSKYIKQACCYYEIHDHIEQFTFQFLNRPEPSINFIFSQNILPPGWHVRPSTHPCSITKEEIDVFSVKSRELQLQQLPEEDIIKTIAVKAPMLRVSIFFDTNFDSSCLDYEVPIEGIKQPRTFHIVRQLTVEGTLSGSRGATTDRQVVISEGIVDSVNTAIHQSTPTTVNSNMPADEDQYGLITDLQRLKTILNSELDHQFADLEALLEANIDPFASRLFQNGMITSGVKSNPSFNAIMREVKAKSRRSANVIVEHYKRFLEIVADFGEPLKDLADDIADNMSKAVSEEFKNVNIKFT